MGDESGIILGPFDRRYCEQTRAWMNDPALAHALGRARPVSDAEHERWFASLAGRADCAFFAILAGTERRHVGNVWLWDVDSRHRKAELRIVLGADDSRGRGWGPEAIRRACAFGFEQLNLHKVYAYVLGFNHGARRAFEKAGFAEEGLLKADRWSVDRYVDVFLLGRLALDC